MNIKTIPDRLPQTLSAQVPAGWRPGGAAAARRGLRAPLRAVTAAADGILQCCTGLGVDATDLTPTADTLLLAVDPTAPAAMRVAIGQLGSIPPVLWRRARLISARVRGASGKFPRMVALYGLATQIAADYHGSRQVVNTLMWQQLQFMKQRFTAALPPGVPLSEAQRDLLRIWQPIADKMQKQAQDTAAAINAGKKAAERRAGELAQAGRHEQMLLTMVALRTGQPVDDAAAAQALATLQAEQAQAQQAALSPLLPRSEPTGRR